MTHHAASGKRTHMTHHAARGLMAMKKRPYALGLLFEFEFIGVLRHICDGTDVQAD